MTAAENLTWFEEGQHMYCLALNAPSISAFLALPASEQQMGLWTSDITQMSSNGDVRWSESSDTASVPSPNLDDAVGPQGVTIIGGQLTGQYESPPSDLSVQALVGNGDAGYAALWLRRWCCRATPTGTAGSISTT